MKMMGCLAIGFVAVLPALAATSCPAGQTLIGSNCTISVALGWVIAGLGTQSIITVYVPPNAAGPVNINVTGMNSSLGSSYTGYFGFKGSEPGQPGSQVLTLSDLVAGQPESIGAVAPGQGFQFAITQVCWDPTCTSPAPAGAVPNMLSLEFLFSSPNSGDINTNDIQLSAQFINGSQVTYETQETAIRTDSLFDIIPGINIGADPAGRYVLNGTAVTLPYDVLSITNLDNPGTISGTATLKDFSGTVIATASIPSIPSGGAAGFLVIGRTPTDPIGLFPSNLVLPAGSDNVFHGILELRMNGLVATGVNIVLAQEFNGSSMLNLPVFHSAVQ